MRIRRQLEKRLIEPTLSIGPQALKKFENASTVPLGNFKFSFNGSTKRFE